MADTPDKPTETSKPAPTRRRGPRKAAPAGTVKNAKAAVRAGTKRVAAKAEQAAEQVADTAVKTERAAVRAVKQRAPARQKAASTQRRNTAKSRARTAEAKSAKRGGWGIAAIAGGIAAAGATVAALLSLRGSSPKPEPATPRATDVAEGHAAIPDGEAAS